MAKTTLLIVSIFAALYLGSILILGSTGSPWLHETSVEAPFWVFSVVVGAGIGVSVFISIHDSRVSRAASEFNPGNNDRLSSSFLIFKPAITSWLIALSFQTAVFLTICGFIYTFDLSSMDNSTSYGLGNIWLFLFFSAFFTLVAISLTVYLSKVVKGRHYIEG